VRLYLAATVRSRFVAWLPVLALLAACGQPAYVARLGWTEARILLRREPIPSVLRRPDVDAGLAERLRLVLAVRAFAEDALGLRVGESYATYAAVEDDARLWILSAARRDRLEPYTWWYPVVGRVPYRGFFDRTEAEAAGQALGAESLDVDIRPAAAFSTLGWFADPLLSTTASAAPVALAETVIHELFHSTLWVRGASAFNESAATFAGHRGAIAFFCAGPGDDPARCAEARRRWANVRARGVVLARLVDRLRVLYAANPAPARRERERAALGAAAGRALARRGAGRADELLPPNNARLLGERVYTTSLGLLERLVPADAPPDRILAALADAVRDAERDPFVAVSALAGRRPGG
jgi:predicted aminopeptidase